MIHNLKSSQEKEESSMKRSSNWALKLRREKEPLFQLKI